MINDIISNTGFSLKLIASYFGKDKDCYMQHYVYKLIYKYTELTFT